MRSLKRGCGVRIRSTSSPTGRRARTAAPRMPLCEIDTHSAWPGRWDEASGAAARLAALGGIPSCSAASVRAAARPRRNERRRSSWLNDSYRRNSAWDKSAIRSLERSASSRNVLSQMSSGRCIAASAHQVIRLGRPERDFDAMLDFFHLPDLLVDVAIRDIHVMDVERLQVRRDVDAERSGCQRDEVSRERDLGLCVEVQRDRNHAGFDPILIHKDDLFGHAETRHQELPAEPEEQVDPVEEAVSVAVSPEKWLHQHQNQVAEDEADNERAHVERAVDKGPDRAK